MDIDININLNNTSPPTAQEQWYAVMHDRERFIWGLDYTSIGYLWREGLPEVYNMYPLHATIMNKSVQQLCYGLLRYGAPSLSESTAMKKYRIVYQDDTAFNNGKGYPHKTSTPRRDYINNLDLDAAYPYFDKPRLCGGALVRGTVSGDNLLVNYINVNNPIPTLEEVIKERLYFAAVSVGANFASDFPQGLGEPIFIPVIASQPVSFPLKFLRKLPLNYDISSHDPHKYVV